MTEEQQTIASDQNINDKPIPGLQVLSFFIPLIGAIMYFANKDEYPVRAKGIGRATLMGLTYFLIYIIFSP
jgi:hypothetical protein